MARWALLSLDLDNNVSSKQRNTCYTELRNRKWVKLSKLTTVWQAKFINDPTETAIINTTKKDVRAATAKANIQQYDAVVHVGASQPTRF